MNVLLEVGDDGTLQLRRRHGNDIKPLKKERQPFAHMTDDDLQPGMSVEQAAAHQSQRVNRGLLPEGVNPTIGPDATSVGWIFEYALVDHSGKHNLAELRSKEQVELEKHRLTLEAQRPKQEVVS